MDNSKIDFQAFGALNDLASEDSGEITSFAADVIDREVNAGKFSNLYEVGKDLATGGFKWLRNNLGDKQKILSKDTFRKFNQNDAIINAVVNKGQYTKVMAHPSVFHMFDDDIATQVRNELSKDQRFASILRDPKKMQEVVDSVKSRVRTNLKNNDALSDVGNIVVPYKHEIIINGKPVPFNGNISLSKNTIDNHVRHLESTQPTLQNIINDTEKSIHSRPKRGDRKTGSDGRPMIWNGVKWVLAVGTGYQAWQHKDDIQNAIQGAFTSNEGVDYNPAATPAESAEKPHAYNPNESNPAAVEKFNPGGQYKPSSPAPSPWDSLRSQPQTTRPKTSVEDDNDWWNTPSSSNRKLDDMGYIGSATEAEIRTANSQSPSYDELDDDALASAAADQVLAAENLLAYYGLGDDTQPAEKIIPSLLLGNFDGMSLQEYQQKHTPAETQAAMKRFKQGLTMFTDEMNKRATALENIYNERQRRFEAKSSSGSQTNEQSR